MTNLISNFTAVYKKSGKWYLGWVEEIPGVNTQGRTLKETKENLKDALSLVLETNRIVSRTETVRKGTVKREPISIGV
ncbi:MAG: type II toxin-antitoxin system HicB family antitoxin [bacterium]|nr:type II toxin-antitoxin system HicB family antitoxin [bacterium]